MFALRKGKIMVKPSKSKIRILISLVLTVVLMTLLFINISTFRNIGVSSCLGQGSRTMGTLTYEEPYQQFFVPTREELSYIEVRFATYTDETAKGSIEFTLLDSIGNILSEKEVAISALQDDAYYRFDTNVKLDTAQTYSYTLQAVDNGWDKAPVTWISSLTGQEQTRLVLPGVSAETQYQTNAQYGYTYFNTSAFAGCIFLILLCGFVSLLQVEISEKRRGLAGRLVLFLMPVAMFFLVEALNDNSAFDKKVQAYPLNYAYYFLLYIIFFVLINRLRISMLISNTIIYFLAVVNYFKLMFRGEPLQPWDLLSAKTAMNVSSSYALSLTVVLISTFLFFVLLNLVSWKIDYSITRIRNRVLTGAASAVLAVLLVFSLFGTDRYAVAAFNLMQKIGITNNVWNQTSNYELNGLVIAFTMNAQYMNVDKPENYSEEAIAELKAEIETGMTGQTVSSIESVPDESSADGGTLSDSSEPQAEITGSEAAPSATPIPYSTPTPTAIPTPAEVSDTQSPDTMTSDGDDSRIPVTTVTPVPVTQETVSNPNIIAIMCESYADLTSIAEYTTNSPVTPNYDAASENVIKGTVYVSTYGGGTANSEFEFLTGNTMAFLPNGSIPYQQYIDSETGSLAQILSNRGYSTIAVHPYTASGWNRPEVYENLGFDQFLSNDDFEYPSYMRGYISDQCSYNKLIELYENKTEGQPLFLFNVTMQNHGGYVNSYANFTEDIKLTEYPGEFPETEQYLSLIHQSDAALKNLIDYFSAADEPTVICFFGDHLPNMKNNFYETILGENLSDLTSEEMLKLYQTPFLIWANYDICEQEIDKISANYLSTLLLQTANIALPDYNQYLSTLFQSFPVIDSMAVIDSDGNVYQTVSSVPGNEAIKKYSILAYNNLFDKSGRNAALFDSASPTALGEGIMITGLPLSGIPEASGVPADLRPYIISEQAGLEAAAVTPVP